jgi:hypothetical protein
MWWKVSLLPRSSYLFVNVSQLYFKHTMKWYHVFSSKDVSSKDLLSNDVLPKKFSSKDVSSKSFFVKRRFVKQQFVKKSFLSKNHFRQKSSLSKFNAHAKKEKKNIFLFFPFPEVANCNQINLVSIARVTYPTIYCIFCYIFQWVIAILSAHYRATWPN